MKHACRLLLVALISLLVLGCANRYIITLSNDKTITTRGKPKLNKYGTAYHYVDLLGNSNRVPVFRVQEISPQ